MILVNLYGQPGAGKSTGAMYITSQLKMNGVNAEFVSEFAKDKVYEESKAVFDNQAYIFGKQWFKISRAEKKVDVIVTDSPLLLSIFYNRQSPNPYLGAAFEETVANVYDQYIRLDYFIERVKPYESSGRFQTEEQSDALVEPMQLMLEEFNVPYMNIQGDESGYDEIVEDVLCKLSMF